MSFAVSVENLSLSLGAFSLRGLSLDCQPGEIVALLGPNGAGKSVTLEAIAGFHRLGGGRIAIGGRDATRLPPERRNVSLLFQNYSLFPHLTVAENVTLASRARMRSEPTERELAALLARFGIVHLASRYSRDLSPGERQRAALARALATAPDLFLFDEPFSALDAATRANLRADLEGFLRQSRIPAIFVSHDHSDVRALADRIAVIRAGEILQFAATAQVQREPSDPFVAHFIGIENVLLGHVAPANRIAIGAVAIRSAASLPSGGPVHVCVRAEDIEVLAEGSATPDMLDDTNALPGRVAGIAELGALYELTLDCGFVLTTHLTAREIRKLSLVAGAPVTALIPVGAVHIIAGGVV